MSIYSMHERNSVDRMTNGLFGLRLDCSSVEVLREIFNKRLV